MKILLTGIGGQVGHYLNKKLSLSYEVIGVTRESFDLTNISQMESVIDEVRPGLIINSAAYTYVDRAEKEPDLVFKTNVVATKFLAKKSENLGIPLIQLSTDYIFDGLKKEAYTESDKPNPQSIYGKSKYDAETVIRECNPKHIILRTSWVYSLRGKNFLTTILDLAENKESFDIVSDQMGSPTSAIFIANTILEITNKIEQIEKNNLYGTYNLTCLGSTTWFEFAKTIILYAKEKGLNLKSTPESINPIKSSEFTSSVTRPKNSTLNNQKLVKTFEINCPEWRNELKLIMSNKI